MLRTPGKLIAKLRHAVLACAGAAAVVCAAPAAFAQATCPSQAGRPSEPLQRVWNGEYVIEATPGTVTCARPDRNFNIACNARGPARVWSDATFTTHNVVPAGRTATFTLSGERTTCVLAGSAPAAGATAPAPSTAQQRATAPNRARNTASSPPAWASAPPAVSTTACQRSLQPPLPQETGLPEVISDPTGWVVYGRPNVVSCVARRGGALCQVQGAGQVLFALQDTELYTVPAGRSATLRVERGRPSCFLNQQGAR